MEEIVERISDNEFTVLVVSVTSTFKYERYRSSVEILLRNCPSLHIVCICEDGISTNYNGNPVERVLSIQYNDANKSPEFEKWLNAASILILVNISLRLSGGVLCSNSALIVSNITRTDVSTFCLHPAEAIRGIGVAGQPEESEDLRTIQSIVQDAAVLHMIGEPVQVLRLMSWSLASLCGLKATSLLLRRKAVTSSLSPVEVKEARQVAGNTEEGPGESRRFSLSEVFHPLVVGMLTQEMWPESQRVRDSSRRENDQGGYFQNIAGTDQHMAEESEATREGESSCASPRRSGRKRKARKITDESADGDLTGGVDSPQGTALRGRGGGKGLTSPGGERRRPKRQEISEYDMAMLQSSPVRALRADSSAGGGAVPFSPDRPTHPTRSPAGGAGGGRGGRRKREGLTSHSGLADSSEVYKLDSPLNPPLLSQPPRHPSFPPQAHRSQTALCRGDSFNRLTDDNSNDSLASRISLGLDDSALSQSSMATLADLAERISSPQRPFRHLFLPSQELAARELVQHHQEKSTSATVSNTETALSDHPPSGLQRTSSASAYPPLSQISSLSTSQGDSLAEPSAGRPLDDLAANATATGRTGTALHRKPSFLPPGAPYDGGGFNFMSGLSQED